MDLTHHRRAGRLLPGTKVPQELGVLIAVVLSVQIFLPQQLQRHAAAAQLPLDDLPVGQWTIRVSPLARRKQPLLQCLLAERQQLFMVQTRGGNAP